MLSVCFWDIPVMFRCILNHFGLRYCRFRIDPDFRGNWADHLQISHIKVGFACLEVSNHSESVKKRPLAEVCVLEKCRKIIGALNSEIFVIFIFFLNPVGDGTLSITNGDDKNGFNNFCGDVYFIGFSVILCKIT